MRAPRKKTLCTEKIFIAEKNRAAPTKKAFAALTTFYAGASLPPLWSPSGRPFTPLGYFLSGDGPCLRSLARRSAPSFSGSWLALRLLSSLPVLFLLRCLRLPVCLFPLPLPRATSQNAVQGGNPMAADGDNGSFQFSELGRAVFRWG